MNADHPGAGTRRGNDMVVALKCVEYLQRDRLRVDAGARIVCRLAAAGLRTRHLDSATRRLEQFDRGEADRSAEINRPSTLQTALLASAFSHP